MDLRGYEVIKDSGDFDVYPKPKKDENVRFVSVTFLRRDLSPAYNPASYPVFPEMVLNSLDRAGLLELEDSLENDNECKPVLRILSIQLDSITFEDINADHQLDGESHRFPPLNS